MRIRKRPLAATSFEKPEFHDGTNGTSLHLHAGSNSNPSSQDARCSLLSPSSIISPDLLLLAGSGKVPAHEPSVQKQRPDAACLQRKPPLVLSSGVESCIYEKGRMMKKGKGDPQQARNVMDVQHHMRVPDADDIVKGMDMKGCKKLGPLQGAGGETEEAYNKARQDNKARPGSVLKNEEINVDAHPAMVDTSDYPRKVRPLQLILSSGYLSPPAPKLPLDLCPASASSSSSVSHMPPCPPPPRMLKSSSVTKASDLFASPAAADKQIAESKSGVQQKPTRDDETCSVDGLVSSWQGNRRPRSRGRGGRGLPCVNSENKPTEQKTRNLNRSTKGDASRPVCISGVQVSTQPASGSGELCAQDCRAEPFKSRAHTKKKKNEPSLLLSSAAGHLLPASTGKVCSIVKSRSLVAQCEPTAAYTHDDHTCSMAPAPPASDIRLQLDSMRCRRKDGRQWRCKKQVIKVGAPFCHYHTLKMREKHAASVARKLLKQLQGEAKIGLSYADMMRSCDKRPKHTRWLVTASEQRAADKEGQQQADEVEEEEEIRENEREIEEQKVLKKQLLVESLTLRRRWRKKCKPCIRRLHDIQDRAGPAATDGLDFARACVEDTYEDISPVRCGSPLPQCLLNTDPYEWRSDVP